MAQVITFVGYRPVERYDAIPWTHARIEEADAFDATTWTAIETVALDPLDTNPADPVYRNLTTEQASDTAALWYRIVWVDATSDESPPTEAVQNVVGEVFMLATVDELARILKIRTPTAEQRSAMERVLIAASGEVNWEVDLPAGSTLSGWQLALATEVTLERAVEHWKQQEAWFGLVDVGGEFGATLVSRDTWRRHAFKLRPLRRQWGIA